MKGYVSSYTGMEVSRTHGESNGKPNGKLKEHEG